ncbi:MAG: LPS export ABC transporter permease LptF [Pseudomonadota bacterium]|nr:LPS export ABC transporter permease LptF [Pseudomonadota bacterium]
MTRLDWYIFRQVTAATVFLTVTLTGVVWLMQSLRFIEMIVTRGLSGQVFLYLTLLLLPSLLSIILPLALVMAVLFTYNRLLSDSELIVIRAGGCSQYGLAKPAILVSLLVMIIGYSLSLYLLPTSFRNFKDLQFQLRNSIPGVLLQEGVFSQMGEGITVFIRKRSDRGELNGIIIHDARLPNSPITMMADEGVIVPGKNGPRVIMVKGNRQQADQISGQLSVLYFDRYSFELASVGKKSSRSWREPKERYLNELFFSSALEKKIHQFHKLRMEGHFRLSMPLLSIGLVLGALGILLSGDLNRRGQAPRILSAVAFSVGIQLGHFALQNLGEKMQYLTLGMYVLPILPALLGIVFLRSWRPIFFWSEKKTNPSSGHD